MLSAIFFLCRLEEPCALPLVLIETAMVDMILLPGWSVVSPRSTSWVVEAPLHHDMSVFSLTTVWQFGTSTLATAEFLLGLMGLTTEPRYRSFLDALPGMVPLICPQD